MFLNKLIQNNHDLIDCALFFFKTGQILPDTYLIDLDAVLENAGSILRSGDEYGVRLYFMLKQLGRNPLIARELVNIKYPGAVAVDFSETEMYIRNSIPLGNVGHLVQIPRNFVEEVVSHSPEIITVYSIEKAKEISDACRRLHKNQDIMLRLNSKADNVYPGQIAGFRLETLERTVKLIKNLPNIELKGLCEFPCFLYDEERGEIRPTPNADTLLEGCSMLRSMGFSDIQVNAPSACCTASIPLIHNLGATHSEPGHGLSGTTLFHAYHDAAERCAYVYLTEVSHVMDNSSYCYGGGNYPRGHIKEAVVGYNISEENTVGVESVPSGNIDYHFKLKGRFDVSQPVLMCFRTQIFVTRSNVAVVKGISKGKPEIVGIFDSQGNQIGDT